MPSMNARNHQIFHHQESTHLHLCCHHPYHTFLNHHHIIMYLHQIHKSTLVPVHTTFVITAHENPRNYKHPTTPTATVPAPTIHPMTVTPPDDQHVSDCDIKKM